MKRTVKFAAAFVWLLVSYRAIDVTSRLCYVFSRQPEVLTSIWGFQAVDGALLATVEGRPGQVLAVAFVVKPSDAEKHLELKNPNVTLETPLGEECNQDTSFNIFDDLLAAALVSSVSLPVLWWLLHGV